MKKHIVMSGIAATLAICTMTAPALAIEDFTDLPKSHWAYADVMKVAEEGIIKGTGNGAFSPNMTLDAAQFLVMVGRTCYDDQVSTSDQDNWYSAYVRAADELGVLDGTSITTDTVNEKISRYDMAAILTNVGKDIIKADGTMADTGDVTDYGDIPNKYSDSVLWAYGTGLLKGDEKGNFNGQNSMTRAMAATVISRLMTLQETPVVEEKVDPVPVTPAPDEGTVHIKMWGTMVDGNIYRGDASVPNVPITLCYDDGTVLAATVTDSEGKFKFDIDIPEKYFEPSGESYYIEGETTYNGKFLTTAYNIPGKTLGRFTMEDYLILSPNTTWVGHTFLMYEPWYEM